MPLKMIDALVLYANDLEKTVAFYRSIGLTLETEEHDGGPIHFVCELEGAHFAIYEAKEKNEARRRAQGGGAQIGFRTDSLDSTMTLAQAAGAKILIAPQSVPWGKRAVLEDPDGRPIELNEAPK